MGKIIHSYRLDTKRRIKQLEAELKKNPQSPEHHFNLGEELMRLFNTEAEKKGIYHLEKAIKLKPDFAEALEFLSSIVIEENPTKGSRLAKKAASLYIAKGDNETAKEILNNTAMHYVYEGWELFETGMVTEAEKKAKKALRIFPDCVDAYNIYGNVYLNNFRFKEAEKTYLQAVDKAIEQQGGQVKIKGVTYWYSFETRPYMRARQGLGLSYIFRGKYKEAMEQFKIILKLNPNDNQGVGFLLGDVCLFLNDINQAKKYYNKYGGENEALFLFIIGEKEKAKKALDMKIKENKFIPALLVTFLERFFESHLRNFRSIDNIFRDDYYKVLLYMACEENKLHDIDFTNSYLLLNAYQFCKIFGPLWIKYGAYDFLKDTLTL